MPEARKSGHTGDTKRRVRRDLRERMETAVISDFEAVGGYALGIFRLVRSDKKPFFEFKAGQYAQLALWDQPEGDVRPRQYSIASSPYNREQLEFYVLLVEDGGALGEDKPGVFTGTLWGHRVGEAGGVGTCTCANMPIRSRRLRIPLGLQIAGCSQ